MEKNVKYLNTSVIYIALTIQQKFRVDEWSHGDI